MPLTTRRAFIRSGTGLAAGAVLSTPSWAQGAWPSRPIRIVVPYTAGGFTDQMARLLQVGLQQRLGQPVVVENKPGANSIIGVDAVANSAPAPPDADTKATPTSTGSAMRATLAL